MYKRTILIWLLLIAVASAHHPMDGRICNSPNCRMCESNHLMAGHDVNGWNYSNPWAIHRALHNPKVIKPKKLSQPRLKFDPTPMSEMTKLVNIIKPRSTDVIYDPGCGDARLLIALCKDSGATGVGFEIDVDIVTLARKKVEEANLTSQISIWHIDSRLVDLKKATVIVMYLLPELINRFDLSSVRIVASYLHKMAGSHKVGDWYVKQRGVF